MAPTAPRWLPPKPSLLHGELWQLLKDSTESSNVRWSEDGSVIEISNTEGLIQDLQKGREAPMKPGSLERRLRYLGWQLMTKETIHGSESTSLGLLTRVTSSWMHVCLTKSSSRHDFMLHWKYSLPEEQASGSASPILEPRPQVAESSTNELEAAAEALLLLGDTSSIPIASVSNALPSTEELSGREDSVATAEPRGRWTNKDMEEIAMLSEAAGIHTCKLDLEECLILDDWYSYFGTFMMPSSACLAVPAGCVSCERLFGGA